MRIKIEGVEYRIPSSLMEVTLGQRIEFEKQYGKELTAQLKKIAEMKGKKVKVTDGEEEEINFEKELAFTDYHYSLACKTLSFFGKIPLKIVENTDITQVLAIYHAYMQVMTEEVDFKQEHDLKREFDWEGDQWTIAPPELNSNSKMSFGEFLDSKQWVKNTYELSQEKWQALIGLCCVYFRKVGEPYTKELIVEGGDRYKLMETLPLPYALEVGFFLNNLVTSYLSISRSSIPMTVELPARN